MSKPSSAPQPERVRISNYCWTEHPGGGRHCCLPKGHTGQHWHPYSRTNF